MSTQSKAMVAVMLKATGEVSKFTGRDENGKFVKKVKGDVVEMPTALAKEAVAGGRWKYVGEPKAEKNTGEGDES